MIVILEFEYTYFLMECPAFVAENIKEYQMKFDEWMGDKTNDHGYWVKSPDRDGFVEKGILDPFDMGRDSNGKDALSYGENAFVNWLNEHILNDSQDKAKIIGCHDINSRNEKGHALFPSEYNYPHLFF